MRAVVVPTYGGPEILEVSEVPLPSPGPGQIRVRVTAAAVNPVDTFVRSGRAAGAIPDPDFPLVLGWDCAGTVDQVGDGVERFHTGDRVLGMSLWFQGRRGTHAEHVVLDEDGAVHTPDGIDDTAAATLPLNGLTAWAALGVSRIGEGMRLLVTGGAGAVGGYLVQLATARGAHVVAVGRSSDLAEMTAFGADVSTDETSKIEPVDALIDTTGKPEPFAGLVRPGGRVILIAGGKPETQPDVTIKSVGVRYDLEGLSTMAQMVSQGSMRLRVAEAMPFDSAARAHQIMEAGGLRGRIVLNP